MNSRTYYMDDCTITVPAGPRDRTVNALEWELENGDKVALVVQREPLPVLTPGVPVSLSTYVAGQTQDYPSQLTGFHLDREEASAPEAPFEMERRAFRWRREQSVLYHHQAYVRIGEGVIVFSVSGKALHREAIDHLLDRALGDLHVRGD